MASGKMRVGYFTQYQVEELDGDDTPLEHMTRADEGRDAGRRARAAGPLRLFRRQGDDRRSASCRAASARGWRLR
jgi:hypothetical protein